eukprot:2080269-Rhodomonas_salina.2
MALQAPAALALNQWTFVALTLDSRVGFACSLCPRYAMPGTDLGYHGDIRLCARYAMPGTDLAYGAPSTPACTSTRVSWTNAAQTSTTAHTSARKRADTRT